MSKFIFGCLCGFLLSTNVWAHDQWANGEPVPPWIKAACCGIADAHHMDQDQVHVVPGGYKFDGYPFVIPENETIPSPDGSYWIFYRIMDSGGFSKAYCTFVPYTGT